MRRHHYRYGRDRDLADPETLDRLVAQHSIIASHRYFGAPSSGLSQPHHREIDIVDRSTGRPPDLA